MSRLGLLWLLAVISSLSLVGAQKIGTVRCYVCRSNLRTGIRDYANCPDIHNATTTTVKYCRACLKYVGGAMTNFTQRQKDIVSRWCYDEFSYNPQGNGIFQLSNLQEPSPGAFAMSDGMSISGVVKGVQRQNKSYLIYGPGNLFVCSDGDLCNDGLRYHGHAVGILAMAFIIYFTRLVFSV